MGHHPRIKGQHDKNLQQTTKQDAFNFLRGKLLSLSTQDGSNGVNEVSFDENSCTMTVLYETKETCKMFFANLDANTIAWDIYDPNKNGENKFAKLLRITIAGKQGVAARKTFNAEGQEVEYTNGNNKTFLSFSLTKAADIPNIQNQLEKALKRLITLCGGEPERNQF